MQVFIPRPLEPRGTWDSLRGCRTGNIPAEFRLSDHEDCNASPMIRPRALFEGHLPVADLQRSIAFYRDTLELQLAHMVAAQQVAFFWIGDPGEGMLGLWETGSAPQHLTLHLALRTTIAQIVTAPAALRAAGVTPLDFDGRPTDEAVVIAWMPAAAVFFRDPDGHLLEYIAMLPDAPRPDLGVVPWPAWRRR